MGGPAGKGIPTGTGLGGQQSLSAVLRAEQESGGQGGREKEFGRRGRVCRGREAGQGRWIPWDWKAQFRVRREGGELQQVLSSGFLVQVLRCVLGPRSGG